MKGLLERIVFEFGDSIIVAAVSITAMLYSNSTNRKLKYSDSLLDRIEKFHSKLHMIQIRTKKKCQIFQSEEIVDVEQAELDSIIEEFIHLDSDQTFFLQLKYYEEHKRNVKFLISNLKLSGEERLAILNDIEKERADGGREIVIYPGTFNLYQEDCENTFRDLKVELQNFASNLRYQTPSERFTKFRKKMKNLRIRRKREKTRKRYIKQRDRKSRLEI